MAKLNPIGWWSAVLAAGFGLVYSVFQVLSELKLIAHPRDLYWLFLPSLPLAPAFLIAMICLHYAVDNDLKLFTAISVAFAVLYSADVSLVYFTQLTAVLPAQLSNQINEKQVLLFDRRTFLMAVDCLGYFFMSFSTLFAAFAFTKDQKNKWLYRGLLFNGLLLPVLILAFFYPVFYYVGAIWMITFPLAMINVAKLFNDGAIPPGKLKLNYEN
jgi:hypothetical protein